MPVDKEPRKLPGSGSNWPWNHRWPWLVALILLGLVNGYIQSFGHGVCIDYVDRPGICTFTSGFGSPGNEILWTVSALFALGLVAGFIRASRHARHRPS